MNKILLVEDNEAISKGLVYSLEQASFSHKLCQNKKDLDKENINNYDLLLLDIMLPDGDGFKICQEIKSKYHIPIIILTAKDEEDDIVLGFDLGCDDYVTKPFKMGELISRIKRIITKENSIMVKNIKLDLDSNKVYVKDELVNLTTLEFKILKLLFSNVNHIITRNQLLESIWDYDEKFVNDNTLTVYIKRIREKLHDEELIKTIKGIGYRVDE